MALRVLMALSPLPETKRSVFFYTRPNCPLCDDARDVLVELAKEFLLKVTEVNILSDPAIYERYKYQIPVIVIDGGFNLWGRIEKDGLRNFLAGH
ncbi:MAG: glutaredoxin family protein [Chloroflexi bacterium]|nr:glutaredoxin family protein [Chloroflexota bacterium]